MITKYSLATWTCSRVGLYLSIINFRRNSYLDMAESESTDASPSLLQLKTMFGELLAETKNDILAQVKQTIDQVYTDFEVVNMPLTEDNSLPQDADSETSSRASLTAKIDQLAMPINDTGDDNELKALALEFSTTEKTSAALNNDLADLING